MCIRDRPQLRRNGFKGDFHGISPVRLFKALLSDPRIETLMKSGEIEVMKHFLFNARTADECWASYLIAKRHKYQIDNFSMWCDYLSMLKKLGQDLRNPKNICPEDFMEAHDNATRKIETIHEKERAEQRRRWEIERREREQQRQLQREKDAEDFIANKSKFFGLVITDGGGLSAFVAFSSLGFYPITPGLPMYVIGSPAVSYTHLDRPKLYFPPLLGFLLLNLKSNRNQHDY